jgi:hypothetical protein
MNERIKKLAEQANDYANHLDKIGVDDGWQNIFNQKFAELIIEECAREVEEFARKWWSIHCHSNKHSETTRKAHDDFCSLQAAIRRRGKTV